jgi:hypothetical protein
MAMTPFTKTPASNHNESYNLELDVQQLHNTENEIERRLQLTEKMLSIYDRKFTINRW